MKHMALFLLAAALMSALLLPAGASGVNSWTQADIPGHNLTLNYTSSFNVFKNDTLGIVIQNIGNESLNDTITVYEINVSETSAAEAEGSWTGSETIPPDSSETINLILNVTTDAAATININIYYNVSSDFKNLGLTAYYPGTVEPPEITSWGNTKTNDGSLSLTINTSEEYRFNATADQAIGTWKWFKDSVNQNNNHDNFNTSWATSGTKTLKVNAANSNGSSNTVTWTVNVQGAAEEIPEITSWGNNKTNDNSLGLVIKAGEVVMFNVTADQEIAEWEWTLNGNDLPNSSNGLTYMFDKEGFYRVAINGSNSNGTTQTIVWEVTVLEKEFRKKITILSWYPQVVDYVYVNGNVNETITYSITTAQPMAVNNWTVDGKPVAGSISGTTASHIHTWDNASVGFHTVIYKGSNNDAQVEFRWYVNVYEIDEIGVLRGGSIFDIIDDALENHVTDIKIRMFKYKIAKNGGNAELIAQKVNQLHDEIAKRQMTREALRLEFLAGNITNKEYVSALKQAQRNAKYNTKLAEEMAKIAKQDLKDEKLSKKFVNISEMNNGGNKIAKRVQEIIKEKSKGRINRGQSNDQ